MTPVMAATTWKNNAELIADVARLGYLRPEWSTLDCTYGLGRFWTVWAPQVLTACDLHTLPGVVEYRYSTMGGKGVSVTGEPVDFRSLPFSTGRFEAVVFDPPYKLNGTPTKEVDQQYGVHEPTRWQDRHALIRAGMAECTRVLAPKGYLLMKCMDQVVSGAVRWQTYDFTECGKAYGLALVDRLDFLTSSRPQPERTRLDGKPSVQQHARRNYSTLLVFRRSA